MEREHLRPLLTEGFPDLARYAFRRVDCQGCVNVLHELLLDATAGGIRRAGGRAAAYVEMLA